MSIRVCRIPRTVFGNWKAFWFILLYYTSITGIQSPAPASEILLPGLFFLSPEGYLLLFKRYLLFPAS